MGKILSQHAFEGVSRKQLIKITDDVMCAEADSATGSVTDVVFGVNDADDDPDIIEWIPRHRIGHGDEYHENIKQRRGIELLQKERIENSFPNAGACGLLRLFILYRRYENVGYWAVSTC